MKKLFYAASAVFMVALFATSCDDVEDEIEDVVHDVVYDVTGDITSDVTEEDLVGEGGQIKSFTLIYDDGSTESYTLGYDSQSRITAIVGSYSYVMYADSEEGSSDDDLLEEDADGVILDGSYEGDYDMNGDGVIDWDDDTNGDGIINGDDVIEDEDDSSVSDTTPMPWTKSKANGEDLAVNYLASIRARIKANNALVTKSDSYILWTAEVSATYTYTDDSVVFAYAVVEYLDGELVDEESDSVTVSLNSDGYVSVSSWTSDFTESWSDGSTTGSYSGVQSSEESFSYNNGYIASYNYFIEWVYDDSYENADDMYSSYTTREEYSFSNGNLITAVESYCDSSSSAYAEKSLNSISYGSNLNNYSIDLSAFLNDCEYSEIMIFAHPGLFGTASTNLPSSRAATYTNSSSYDTYTYAYEFNSDDNVSAIEVSHTSYYGSYPPYRIEFEYY